MLPHHPKWAFHRDGSNLAYGYYFYSRRHEFLDEHIRDGGWSIEGTVRQELGNMCCPIGGPYFEIGGSYMHNYGIDEFVTTSGTLVEIPLGLPPVNMPLQDFFFTRLNHLQRASLQLGLGAAWLSPPFLNPSYNDKVLLNVCIRGGVRFGHVHARYDQQPTPDLQTLIDAVPATSTFVLRDDASSRPINSLASMSVPGWKSPRYPCAFLPRHGRVSPGDGGHVRAFVVRPGRLWRKR